MYADDPTGQLAGVVDVWQARLSALVEDETGHRDEVVHDAVVPAPALPEEPRARRVALGQACARCGSDLYGVACPSCGLVWCPRCAATLWSGAAGTQPSRQLRRVGALLGLAVCVSGAIAGAWIVALVAGMVAVALLLSVRRATHAQACPACRTTLPVGAACCVCAAPLGPTSGADCAACGLTYCTTCGSQLRTSGCVDCGAEVRSPRAGAAA
jgi:hypothetical protein